jgi:hypothetical protein
MRTLKFSCGARLLIAISLLAASALADKPVDQPRELQKQGHERRVFVTGSLIPQRINLKQIGTRSVSPIRMIGRREIDESGRRTTQGALTADPSVREINH